jgi:hypothetical protein
MRNIARRLAILSALGGGVMTDVATLSEAEKSGIADEESDDGILLAFSQTGFIRAKGQGEQLESLLDKILAEDSAVAKILEAIDNDRFQPDANAAMRIKVSVLHASSQRNIICQGAPMQFLEEMNKDYQCVAQAEKGSISAQAIFIDPNGDNAALLAFGKGDNDPHYNELKRVLKSKVLLPKNDLDRALTLMEYSFGIYFKKGPFPNSKEPETGGAEVGGVTKWAMEMINEKWADIQEVEKQAAV